jgi:hypothetical protein
MTAIMLANHSAFPTGPALDTTVTIGSGIYFAAGTSTTYYAYGYASGVDYLSLSNFGSIGTATYTDGGSNSRTISAIYYTEPSASGNADDLYFCLNATGISNSDTTFVSIEYNGQTYTRSSATYTGSTGSCSTWRWLDINPNGPTIGTPNLKVFI